MSYPELISWKSIQESLSKTVGYALQAIDIAKDFPLFSDSQPAHPFCEALHAHPEGRKLCRNTCESHILQTEKSSQVRFFKCPAQLNIFSIPLKTDREDRKVVLGGWVYHDYQEVAAFKKTAGEFNLDFELLADKSKEVRLMDKAEFEESARMVESMAVQFFRSVHLRKSADERANKLGTLLNMTQELDQRLGERDFFGLFLNTLGILFNGETLALLKLDSVTGEYKTFEAFGKSIFEIASFKGSVEEGVLGKALAGDVPFYSADRNDIFLSGFPENTLDLHLFPLGKSSCGKFLLAFINTSLSEEEVRMIRLFCHQASVILENQRLERALKDHQKDARVLMEFSSHLGSTLDSGELFKTIVDQSTEILQAENGSLLLLDEETGDLKIRYIRGMNQKIIEGYRIQPGIGIAGKVLEEGVPLLVQNIEKDPRLLMARRPRYKTGSFLSVPIKLNQRTIGVINISDKTGDAVFNETDLQLALTISGYASMAIERSEFYRRSEELRQISITDTLSGLLNRRYFQERLAEEVERSKRHGLPLSLIIMDIDDFKIYNDLHGHLAGDEAISLVGKNLRNNIRTIDVAARYGGEEFTVILPQTAKQDAAQIAKRLCSEIERTGLIEGTVRKTRPITVSIGLASFPEDADTLENFFKNADDALYTAKREGKNRVVIFKTPGV
ncbi:MAG TPA: diguanylate cyclase [Nitrospiria bacterium]|nr:diguanylate cyclase [Nitrospiria bacterium]